jgi:hypothetical protein
MGKYLLENVHAHYPEAQCAIVVANHGDMLRNLFQAYPWLDVREVNRKEPSALLSLWKDFHGSGFVVTQYAGKKGGKFSFASKLAARMLARRGALVGFTDASRANGMLYDALVPFTSVTPAELERAALRAAGIPVVHAWPTLTRMPLQAVPEKFGLVPKQYRIVHLFAGNKSRGLHPEKKRELLTALHVASPETTIVVSGGKGDREEAESVAAGLPVSIIAGETTLQELMALMAASKGVVSLDTGAAHMAAQLGTPLVVLAGCLGRHWWQEGQYPPDAPIKVFSRADLCAEGHKVADGYSACLGEIVIPEVVYTATQVLV